MTKDASEPVLVGPPLQTGKRLRTSNPERYRDVWGDRWVPNQPAEEALERLLRVLTKPEVVRRECVLLVSETNNGKTMIIQKLMQMVSEDTDADEAKGRGKPIICVETPPAGNATILLGMMLKELNAPYPPASGFARRYELLFEQLPKAGVKMLVFDEVHNVLSAKRAQQMEFFQLLKNLSNRLRIPIVCIGTPEAHRAFQTDQQIGNRFKPYVIRRWKSSRDSAGFMAGLAHSMGMENVSIFKEGRFRRKVLELSDGLTGEIKDIIALLVEKAFEQGKDELTLDMLDEIDWVRPGERRHAASRQVR